jgi:hypothetical protein
MIQALIAGQMCLSLLPTAIQTAQSAVQAQSNLLQHTMGALTSSFQHLVGGLGCTGMHNRPTGCIDLGNRPTGCIDLGNRPIDCTGIARQPMLMAR